MMDKGKLDPTALYDLYDALVSAKATIEEYRSELKSKVNSWGQRASQHRDNIVLKQIDTELEQIQSALTKAQGKQP